MFRRSLLGAVFLMSLISLVHSWGSSDKVLLKSVDAITLYDGRKTTGRRSSPVPQLVLKGGSAANAVGPLDVVQCYNRGHDGYDVQWECVANLPEGVKLGHVDVNCEGFDYPDDPYVLKGSCGLSYTLDYAKGHKSQSNSNSYGKSYYQSYHKNDSSGSHWFVLLIVAGVVYFVYKSCLAPQTRAAGQTTPPPSYEESTNTRPRRNRLYPDIPPPSYPGTEPSAPPTENDPPPAYGWTDNVTGTGSGTSTASGSRTHTIFDTPTQSQTRTQTNTNTNTGGPGFWSGIAAGGIMGYLFGNRGRRQYYNQPYYGQQRPYSSWWGPSSNSWGHNGGGWWSRNSWGNGGNNGWGSGWGNGWSSGWGSANRSSGGGGGNTTRSSGFGGTSRR